MTRFERTGATAPAWIRETVRHHERAWPPKLLATAVAVALAAGLLLGGLLWTSRAAVYYALP